MSFDKSANRQDNQLLHRERLTVRGVVQGVGFRPFVYRLASELNLLGWVRNDASGVTVEVQGMAAQLAELQRRLIADKPAAARIDAIETQAIPLQDSTEFAILASDSTSQSHTAAIGPDLCTCQAWLA